MTNCSLCNKRNIMKRETISLRVTEEEKLALEKLGEGSISRGFRELIQHVDIATLMENKDKGLNTAECEIKDIEATLNDYLKNNFFIEDEQIKKELVKLQKDLNQRKNNFVQNKLKGLKGRLKNLTSYSA